MDHMIWTISFGGYHEILTYPVKLTGDAADGASGTTAFDISWTKSWFYEFVNHVLSNKDGCPFQDD